MNMNKKIIMFFLFSSIIGISFAIETVPYLNFNNKIDLYLGLRIESLLKTLGEPDKKEEICFSKDKPDFTEIWLYYDGLTVSYYAGEKTLRRIILTNSSSYILYNNKKISIIESREKDIHDTFGKSTHFFRDNYSVQEYVFKKINEHYFIFDHIQFFFNQNNVLEKIIILDDTNFL